MAAIRTIEVSPVLHGARHARHVRRIHRVVVRADGHRRHRDAPEISRSVPRRELAACAQLARSLHRYVDLWIQVLESALDRVGPRIKWRAQDVMNIVVLHQQLHVTRVLVVLRCLERSDFRKDRRIDHRHQHALGIFVVGRDTRHHVGNDQPLQVMLIPQRVLEREDAAP